MKSKLNKLYAKMCDGGAYAMGTLLLMICVLAPAALVIWLLQIILKLLGVM